MDAHLIEALRSIVGDAGLVRERARRVAYESDGLAMLHRIPELVLLPRNTTETARCMRLLHENGVPVVARGAGTGLSGGATPVEGGVVIATSRMRDILELSAPDRLARVQAGVVNADLSVA